jgi:hypothetical protein
MEKLLMLGSKDVLKGGFRVGKSAYFPPEALLPSSSLAVPDGGSEDTAGERGNL